MLSSRKVLSRAGRPSAADKTAVICEDEDDHQATIDSEAQSSRRPPSTRPAAKDASSAWAALLPKNRDTAKKSAQPKTTKLPPAAPVKASQKAVVASRRGDKQEKRKRAESVADSVESTGTKQRAAGKGDTGARQRLNVDSLKSERHPKKAKVGDIPGIVPPPSSKSSQMKRRKFAAARVEDEDDRTSAGPRPQARSIPSQARTSTRSAGPDMVQIHYEDNMNDSGEEEVIEDEDDDELLEQRDIGVSQGGGIDLDSEHVVFARTELTTGDSESAGDDSEQDHDEASTRPPRFRLRSVSSRASSIPSSRISGPPTSDTDSDNISKHGTGAEDSDVDADSGHHSIDLDSGSDRVRSRSRYAMRQSQAVSTDSDPESSDSESSESNDVVDVAVRPSQKLTEKQKAKLEQELPKIREHASESKKTARKLATESRTTDTWKERTELVIIKGKREQTMKLKSGMQNAAVKRVLDHSYPIGDRIIVFGDPGSDIFTYDVAALKTIATPMQREILDQVAWDALVAAADQCGYDGEGDIAARLLDPTEFSTYAKPLIAYDGFDVGSPYENPIIKPAVRATFFSTAVYLGVGMSNMAYFKSTSVTAASEPEIPPMMLALVMTAVQSIINDHCLRVTKATAFGSISAPVYREHLIRLIEFRHEVPRRYHRIMHDIFNIASTGKNVHTGNQGKNRDWSGVRDE